MIHRDRSHIRLSRDLAVLVIGLAAALAMTLPAVAQSAHPNVLFILVDDLRPSFPAYGESFVHAPNLERLTSRGMRFDRAYCNQALCAPSRASLLTGMRSTTSGVYDLGTSFRARNPDAVTLPQRFKAAGYRTEAVGKVFHIGHGGVDDPRSWSIAAWSESPIDYAMTASTGGRLTREEALFANWRDGDPMKLPRGAAWERAPVEDDAYADGRIAREAVRRLRAAAESPDQPFFLAVGFTKPHMPFCAPAKYWDLYDPPSLPMPPRTTPPEGAPAYAAKPARLEIGNYEPIPGGDAPLDADLTRTLVHGYYASLSYMDAQLGLVLDELDRVGLASNTIVVLWGDHGFHLGLHGSWTKHTNYEQDTRIPLLIVAPGTTTAASATPAIVESVDLYPTLVELAGPPAGEVPQHLDGVSLVPVLRRPESSVRDHAYHAYPRGERLGRAIRTERYRMVEWKRIGAPPATAEYELYDYSQQAWESRNIAAEQPAVLEALKAILAGHPEAAE
jgi:iduronate 2-sulfatase